MVVVAIIGILSAIAIPQINKYMARARQTEAKTNLASIYTANKAFYAEYNIYDSRFDVIGYRPEGKLRYNLGWNSSSGQCTLPNFGYTGKGSDGAVLATNALTHCTDTIDNQGRLSPPNGVGCAVMEDGRKEPLDKDELVCQTSFRASASGKISTGSRADHWSIDQTKVLTNDWDGTQ